MNKLLQVRLKKSHQEKLTFLYKLYQVKTESDSDRFRELLDALYSEKVNPSSTPTLSTSQHLELELLSDWDCAFRAVVYRFDKFTKKQVPFVYCSAMNTRKILGTNVIDIAVCKKCHLRGASTNFVALPAPKKPLEKEKVEFLDRARKQRKCVDCGEDITGLAEWKSRCMSCWRKSQSPALQGERKPLAGSPMALRMKEAEAIRRANEKLNNKSKEE